MFLSWCLNIPNRIRNLTIIYINVILIVIVILRESRKLICISNISFEIWIQYLENILSNFGINFPRFSIDIYYLLSTDYYMNYTVSQFTHASDLCHEQGALNYPSRLENNLRQTICINGKIPLCASVRKLNEQKSKFR